MSYQEERDRLQEEIEAQTFTDQDIEKALSFQQAVRGGYQDRGGSAQGQESGATAPACRCGQTEGGGRVGTRMEH